MKTTLQGLAIAAALLFTPVFIFGQAPDLGSAANFVLFSTNGPLNNTGTSPLTGDIGTNNGTSSNFANLIGSIHDQNGTSALCATDLLQAYNQINNTPSTLIATPTLGNGQIITAGSYCVSTLSSLNGTITFDGQSDQNAVFIIQIQAAFSTNAGAQVNLINGAKACNVFWKVEGAVGMAAGTTMRGTVIANNGAIILNSGVTIEGRALTTTGAITIDNTTGYLPTTCNNSTTTITSPPVSQTVCEGTSASFSVAVSDTGLTYQWRKGTTNINNGANISGATSSVLTISSVNVSDIAGDYNVVVSGASQTITSSMASLEVNTPALIAVQPENTTGCVDYDKASFMVSASGTGLTYQWRRGTTDLTNSSNISGANSPTLTINLVSNGDLGTDYNVVVSGLCAPAVVSSDATLSKCLDTGLSAQEKNAAKVIFYPNPFTTSLNFVSHEGSEVNKSEIRIYNLLGAEMMNIPVTQKVTSIETADLPRGVYFFKVICNTETVQSGRMISQQ